MYKTRADEVEPKITPSGAKVWWLIAEEDGAPNFEMRYFEIEPGAATGGHPHFFEHQVFVVRGEGKIIGNNDEEIQIRPEDAVLIPSREKHKIVNTGDCHLGFICSIPKGKENEIK